MQVQTQKYAPKICNFEWCIILYRRGTSIHVFVGRQQVEILATCKNLILWNLAHITKIAVVCSVSVAMVTITPILTLVTTLWVDFTHVFEIFLAPLTFFYLDCKFSLRDSHAVYIFLLTKQLHKVKMADFEKICQN